MNASSQLVALVAMCMVASVPSGPLVFAAEPDGVGLQNYDQWKLAAASGTASADSIESPPGFKVELIRSAASREGSWVAVAIDPQGRIIIAREDRGLLRLTLGDDKTSVVSVETIDNTLQQCRGLLFAHDSLYALANNSKKLVRLRDSDNDGTFEQVDELRQFPGELGHGRNSLAVGNDGMIYLAMGNNVSIPADDDVSHSPYRNFGTGRLLPCVWNEFLFDSDTKPPAGYIVRCDRDGKEWQLVAGGFRNPYGLALNTSGELFTYDADMEWDVGAPWYRATRILHVVPGGEYGWRQGTSVWPDHFADMLPGVVDVGLGSPTGTIFGTRSNFPDPYREALFVLEWAYGRILAVHTTSEGASYTGRVEPFIRGRPLNVTGVDFGPDGSMYFTVGGRKTQAALYRVRYVGDKSTVGNIEETTAKGIDARAEAMRKKRRELERLDDVSPEEALNKAWPELGSTDRWVAAAARIAVEHQPIGTWKDKALSEPDPAIAAMACLALARSAPQDLRAPLLARLEQLSTSSTSPAVRLVALRALQLTLIRAQATTGDDASGLADTLDELYPSTQWPENELLCELLVHFGSHSVIRKSLDLIDAADTQEQRLFYLFAIRRIRDGWTLDDRRRYFTWLKQAEQFRGAHYIARYVTFIRTDALATLTDDEKKSLQSLLDELGRSRESLPAVMNRPMVKAWTLDELLEWLPQVSHGRSYAQGKAMFAAALCVQCHRFGDSGVAIGPDLAAIAARFSRRDILESIVQPSKVVEEKYRSTIIETDDGRVIIGQIVGGDEQSIALSAEPFKPSNVERVKRSSIERRSFSKASMMPEGLLNTLSREEILDLIAFLESAGNADHADFAR